MVEAVTNWLDPEAMRRYGPPLPTTDEQLLWSGSGVRIGQFRAYPEDGHFQHSGVPGEYLICFPATSVWIEHQDARAFVADRNVVTLYNPADVYCRAPLSPLGDHGHWFSFSEDLLEEALNSDHDRQLGPGLMPFRLIPSSAPWYRDQELLVRQLQHPVPVDDFEVVSGSLGLLQEVASAIRARLLAREATPSTRHQRLTENARALIARHYRDNLPIQQLASELGCSPYHLCRVFQRCAGTSIHRYLTDLRIRRALIELRHSRVRLIDLALDLGFSSHSHFSLAFRRSVGMTPAAFRDRQGRVQTGRVY